MPTEEQFRQIIHETYKTADGPYHHLWLVATASAAAAFEEAAEIVHNIPEDRHPYWEILRSARELEEGGDA